MIQVINLLSRDGGIKKVQSTEYLNIARSSKSSINYFGDNLPHCNDWFTHRAAIKMRIKNLERQLKNAQSAAVLLRDLVIAEELEDEKTYPKELLAVDDDSDQIDIIKELEEAPELNDSEDLDLTL
jgi:hypothetical protein